MLKRVQSTDHHTEKLGTKLKMTATHTLNVLCVLSVYLGRSCCNFVCNSSFYSFCFDAVSIDKAVQFDGGGLSYIQTNWA